MASQSTCQEPSDCEDMVAYLPLVLDFVGSLLKLANLPDDVRYL